MVDRRGVPWAGLLVSNLFACICFLSVSAGSGVIYEALITLSGVATFIVWGTIELVHIRFRQAMVAQGEDINKLPFKALWYPYGTYAALAANVFLVFFQGYTAFLSPFSWREVVVNYILLPVFVILGLGYKWWNKTKLVGLLEMDLFSGRREVPEEEAVVESTEKKGAVRWIMGLRRVFVG